MYIFIYIYSITVILYGTVGEQMMRLHIFGLQPKGREVQVNVLPNRVHRVVGG